MHGHVAGQRGHLLVETVPAGDLERHQAHLPGAARHGQRRARSAPRAARRRCGRPGRSPGRPGWNRPARRRSSARRPPPPGRAAPAPRRTPARRARSAPWRTSARRPARCWPRRSERAPPDRRSPPGRTLSSRRCSGSMECRWVPDRASRASRPQTLSLNACRSSSPCQRPASRAAAPSGSAATSAPLIAPTDVPTTRSGRMPASDKARSMPTSWAPRMPPPPSTNAVCTRPASPSSATANPSAGRCWEVRPGTSAQVGRRAFATGGWFAAP